MTREAREAREARDARDACDAFDARHALRETLDVGGHLPGGGVQRQHA